MVAVAASAGGVTALRTFVSRLPEDFPAAVLVVLHIPARGPTVLPEILSRAGPLPARHPADGEPLAGGVILVAPPDWHLAAADGCARLLASPPEHLSLATERDQAKLLQEALVTWPLRRGRWRPDGAPG